MRNITNFAIIAFMALICISCSASKALEKEGNTDSVKVYTNEFFSMAYPGSWVYEEEINDMADTVPALSKGVRVTFYDPNPGVPYLTIAIQKSALTGWFETPEEWRDLSVELKNLDPEYLAPNVAIKKDSIMIGQYPAALAFFMVVPQNGDTLFHKQIVLMDGKDVYYLNNTFESNDSICCELQELGDIILSTFRIK